MKTPLDQKKLTYASALLVTLFGIISAFAVWQLIDREELINDPSEMREAEWREG